MIYVLHIKYHSESNKKCTNIKMVHTSKLVIGGDAKVTLWWKWNLQIKLMYKSIIFEWIKFTQVNTTTYLFNMIFTLKTVSRQANLFLSKSEINFFRQGLEPIKSFDSVQIPCIKKPRAFLWSSSIFLFSSTLWIDLYSSLVKIGWYNVCSGLA